MSHVAKHIVLPSIAPLAIVGLYFTPVSLIGCLNRGLIALAIVLISWVAGMTICVRGIRGRSRGESMSVWWIASASILALPALLVLGPLG